MTADRFTQGAQIPMLVLSVLFIAVLVTPIINDRIEYAQRSLAGCSRKSRSTILPRKNAPMPAGSAMTKPMSRGRQSAATIQ